MIKMDTKETLDNKLFKIENFQKNRNLKAKEKNLNLKVKIYYNLKKKKRLHMNILKDIKDQFLLMIEKFNKKYLNSVKLDLFVKLLWI